MAGTEQLFFMINTWGIFNKTFSKFLFKFGYFNISLSKSAKANLEMRIC